MEFDHPASPVDACDAPLPAEAAYSVQVATLLGGRLRYRRLGDAGIVFDFRDWRTHVLSAGAAAVFELLVEHSPDHPLSEQDVRCLVHTELDLDPYRAEVQEILLSFRKLGILAE